MNLEKQSSNHHKPNLNPNTPRTTSSSVNMNNNSRLEKISFWILLVIIIFVPLAFWPSISLSQEFVKTFVIFFGTIFTSVLLILAIRHRENIYLPPKRVTFATVLVIFSLLVSTFAGAHISKSFFGQGFELGTTSIILLLFLGALVSYILVLQKVQRVVFIQIGIIVSFVGVAVSQLARLISVSQSTSTLSLIKSNMLVINGGWNSLAIFSLLVTIISMVALLILPLSRSVKYIYGILVLVGIIGAALIGNVYAWICMVVVGGFLLYHNFKQNIFRAAGGAPSHKNKITFVLLVIVILSAGLAWKGNTILGIYINKVNPGYTEIVFPWKYTSEIIVDTLKDKTLFGFGPNNFLLAYLDYKPADLNLTPAWSAEFTSGFSTISTFIITQGLVGGLAWLFFILVFILITLRVFRNLPSDAHQRFMLISSFTGALFLWIMMLLSTPSHSLVFYTFILTGAALGVAVSVGSIQSIKINLQKQNNNFAKYISFIGIIVVIVWGLFYVRQSIAVVYFASGFRSLTVQDDPGAAIKAFDTAAKFYSSDIFWRAKVEAILSNVTKVVLGVDNNKQKPEEKAIIVTGMINDALVDARKAIAYDPNNYYNHISEGRVFETASKLEMNGAIDATIQSYKNAIQTNPHNPTLYLILSRFQASVNKLDDALQTAGLAIEEKQDYLEAVYLISQIQAAKGNITDAITAAKVATEINPGSPLLWFQLGVLNYTSKQYNAAIDSFNKALTLASDYANAQYFLGLSYAYQNKTTLAIELFKKLTVSNPDNQEVKLILKNLRAGKQPFADASTPISVSPEKRSSLPIKENN